MAGRPVAYIAAALKMAASKESFLAQRVYEQIREQIQNGKLSPGTRLVNRKLAGELGTSMVPIREALNRLTSEGLLEHLPGGGNFHDKPGRTNEVWVAKCPSDKVGWPFRGMPKNRQMSEYDTMGSSYGANVHPAFNTLVRKDNATGIKASEMRHPSRMVAFTGWGKGLRI